MTVNSRPLYRLSSRGASREDSSPFLLTARESEIKLHRKVATTSAQSTGLNPCPRAPAVLKCWLFCAQPRTDRRQLPNLITYHSWLASNLYIYQPMNQNPDRVASVQRNECEAKRGAPLLSQMKVAAHRKSLAYIWLRSNRTPLKSLISDITPAKTAPGQAD